MKINLYAVGRSGTKALQQYIAWAMVEKYGRIGINYEPFLWAGIRAHAYCRNGIRSHEGIPLFTERISQQEYRKIIGSLSFYENGITKFIYGCGRIQAINEIMQPDWTIVLVRDAIEVVNSLMGVNWDFFTRRFSTSNDWERFKEEGIEKAVAPDFANMIGEIEYEWEKHIMFWYGMNYFALDNCKSYGANTCFLWFRDYSVYDLLERLGLPVPPLAIEQCYGGLLHTSALYKIEPHIFDQCHNLYGRIMRRSPIVRKHIKGYVRKKPVLGTIEKFSGAGKPNWIWETEIVKHARSKVSLIFGEALKGCQR